MSKFQFPVSSQKKTRKPLWRKSGRGQSLVEFVLVLPVLLTILAGVVEVANILTIYNRVQLSAREGARFGAEGGSDSGVMQVVTQTNRESIATDSARMRVWIIRPIINVAGGVWTWQNATVGQPWGTPEVCLFPNTGCAGASPLTPDMVRNSVSAIVGTGNAGISGTRFVIVIVAYESDTILNLPWFTPDADGRFPMWAYAIMRQEVAEQSVNQIEAGCSAYPFALELGRIPATVKEGDILQDVPLNHEVAAGPYPQIRNGFRFLGWRAGHQNPNWVTNTSDGSLLPPGSSLSPVIGFQEYGEPADTSMHRGDWVTYNESSVDSSLADHRTTGRTLRIIIYKLTEDPITHNPVSPGLYDYGAGALWMYQIYDFAIVRVNDFVHAGSSDTIDFEWVKWDTGCGYDLNQ